MDRPYSLRPSSPDLRTPFITPSDGDVEDRPPLPARDSGTTNDGTSTLQHEIPQSFIDAEENKKIVQASGSVNRLTLTAIIAGWVLAVIIAIAHHTFLSNINGKTVVGDGIMNVGSQFWIKSAGSAFVRGMVLALTVSAAVALTQMEWRSSLKNTMCIADLDRLFILPSLTSFLSLLFNSLAPFLVLTLTLTAAIHALEVVTILAPNALKVVPSSGAIKCINASSLDLARGNLTSIDTMDQSYLRPSAEWTRMVQRVVMFPDVVSLAAPTGCGVGCNYSITYRAPALNCRDLMSNELAFNGPDSTIIVYNATSSLNQTQLLNDGYVVYGMNVPYDLTVEWQTVETDSDGQNPTIQGRGGVYCQFHNALYSASVIFNGTSQSIASSVAQLGDVLVGTSGGANDSCIDPSVNGYGQDACFIMGTNFRATCDVFARSIVGLIQLDKNGPGGLDIGALLQVVSGSPQLTPLLDVSQSVQNTGIPYQFGLAVLNLSNSLTSIFTNVTLGMIGARSDFVEVEATVSSGETEWSYNPWILWAIYSPTLLVFLSFGCYGAYCVVDGGAMDASLSAFVVATRNEDIDRACRELPDLDTLKKVKLRYEREGVFIVDM